MYEIVRCPPGQHRRNAGQQLTALPHEDDRCKATFALRMQQNRSSFPRDARGAFSILVTMLVCTSILPALHGYWAVPLFSTTAMALLVGALEYHSKTAPISELLEFHEGSLRHWNECGHFTELPAYWAKLDASLRTPFDLRLTISSRDQSVEIARCLSLEEKRDVAPVIAAALARARESLT